MLEVYFVVFIIGGYGSDLVYFVEKYLGVLLLSFIYFMVMVDGYWVLEDVGGDFEFV